MQESFSYHLAVLQISNVFKERDKRGSSKEFNEGFPKEAIQFMIARLKTPKISTIAKPDEEREERDGLEVLDEVGR